MSELRLVPAALLVWAVTLTLLLTGSWVLAVMLTVLAAAGLVALRQPGQAVFTGALGAVALLLALVRVRQAEQWYPPLRLTGTLSAAPVEVAGGRHLLRIAVPGHPSPLPVFTEPTDQALPVGAQLRVRARWSESERPGVGTVVGDGEVELLAPPEGLGHVAHVVRTTFRETVDLTVGDSSRGLVPGMVLGDVSGQGADEKQLYIATGLSHLSAVSGANVAIVTTVAVLACRAFTLGPRVQVVVAGTALLGFVVLVGTEPSVLRASVTGLVGLLAVLGSTRLEPVHGLCIAVIGLILWDTDLAVSYGFALSVAATAGIVVLHPLLHRPLARTGLPTIVVRALAVAIAADLVTMPIIALMAGEVSVVSVLANLLVAPAVPPVTVLGLVAAGLALVPGPWARLPLKILEPCTWWIHTVAQWCADLPVSTVPAEPAWVLVAYGWILAGVVGGRPRLTALVLATWWLWHARGATLPAEVPLENLHVHVVATVEDVGQAPPGTQVIVVTDPAGRPANRPTVTPAGVPVLFPHRDGPVTLHVDGTQHADDGRF